MAVDLQWLIIVISLMLGGILKGATGVGAPILAVPAIAAVFGVPFALTIMVLPNFVMNVWQIWRFRKEAPAKGFLIMLIAGGVVGVLLGTLLLASAPGEALSTGMAILLIVYIAIRTLHANWAIQSRVANWLALPAGLVGGILQGSTGLSAPVTITFLNAIRQTRGAFIFTISSLFTSFGTMQVPALYMVGILNKKLLLLSALAVIPMVLSMPLGVLIARKIKPAMFDRIIVLILLGIAIKLLIESVFYA